MAARFETFTLAEVKQAGPAFLWPAGDAMMLMPPATWWMVETNPDHPADLPVAATLSLDGRRVATVTLANQTIEFRGKRYPCLWGHALESAPDVRSAGIGGLFMGRVLRLLQRRGVAYGSYGGSPDAVGLFRALRMADAIRV